MSDKSRQMTPEEAAEFAEQVFNKAREGDAAAVAVRGGLGRVVRPADVDEIHFVLKPLRVRETRRLRCRYGGQRWTGRL